MKWIDITLPMEEGRPNWPGDIPFAHRVTREIGRDGLMPMCHRKQRAFAHTWMLPSFHS